tara:strand:+ start:880 stop:1323 length:444 start_codon:yes stop_codon:yes gene_type:complete
MHYSSPKAQTSNEAHITMSTPNAPVQAASDAHIGERMELPVFDVNMCSEDMDKMAESAVQASNFLKAISHEGRLMILCHLASGEKSVTELEMLLSARQAAVSQQLSRLRLEGLVTPRREGKTIYYTLADDRPKKIMEVVYDLFCREK